MKNGLSKKTWNNWKDKTVLCVRFWIFLLNVYIVTFWSFDGNFERTNEVKKNYVFIYQLIIHSCISKQSAYFWSTLFNNSWIVTSFRGRKGSFSKFCQTSLHVSIILTSPLISPNITEEYPIAAECNCVILLTCSSPSTCNKAKSANIFKS